MNRTKLGLFFVAASLMACHAATAQTVTPTPLTAEDIVSMTTFAGGIHSYALSPDGLVVAYVLETNPFHSNTGAPTWTNPNWGHRELWIQSTASGAPRRISLPEGYEPAENPNPAWSPDGKWLLAYAHEKNHGRIAVWNKETDRVHLLEAPVDPVGLWRNHETWSPDSTRVLLRRVKDEPEKAIAEKSPSPQGLPAPEMTVYVSPAIPETANQREKADGDSKQDKKETADFALVDVKTGRLTPVGEIANFVDRSERFSPDGKKLAYTVETGHVVNTLKSYSIRVVSLLDGSTEVLGQDFAAPSAEHLSWSQDGTKIAFVGNKKDDPNTDDQNHDFPGRCYVVDLHHPEVRREVGGLEFAQSARIHWSPDDATVYVRTAKQDIQAISLAIGERRSLLGPGLAELWEDSYKDAGPVFNVRGISSDGGLKIYQINKRSAAARLLFEGFQFIHDLFLSNDGSRAAWVQQDVGHPEDLWVGKGDFSDAHQLTHLNPQIESKALPTEQRNVTWQTRGGQTRFGVVLLPAGYRPGRAYPTLVYVYPGAANGSELRTQFGMRGSTLDGPYLNLALYASHGYAIFVPDSELRIGHPMQDIADEILPGVDKIVEMGIADPERLGVFGQSYGGYGTFALIAQTTRFKAAVSTSGVANLITTAYQMLPNGGDDLDWAEGGQGRLSGSVWQYRDQYIENSPFFYFDRVQTPVLIEYGSEDEGIAPLSREAFVALRSLKKTATLVGYTGQGHTLTKPEDEIDFCNRAIAWFDKYVKGEGHAR